VLGVSLRIRSISVALCCVLALAGAAIAEGAGSGLIEVSKSFQLNAGSSGFARVVCPSGKAAVAQGFDTQVNGGAIVVPEVTTIFSARRLGLTAENIGNAPGKATGFVYCSNLSPGKVTSKSNATALSPHEASFTTAKCPDGTFAIGGAFNTKPDAPVRVSESRLLGGTRWQFAGRNNADSAEVDLEAQVICQQRKSKLQAHSSNLLDGTKTVTASAKCEPSERLISGGYSAIASSDDGPVVNESRRTGGRTWTVSAFTEGEDVSIQAYAYCAAR
jgi:hypothetical protein